MKADADDPRARLRRWCDSVGGVIAAASLLGVSRARIYQLLRGPDRPSYELGLEIERRTGVALREWANGGDG